AGRRAHPRPPAQARAAPLRAVPDQRRRQRGQERLRKDGLAASIRLDVRRLRDDVELPSRAYDGDAGIDLVADEGHRLGPADRAVIGTGLSVAIPAGFAGLVLPRSGLAARHGLTVVNAPGLVDSGYRGEVRVILLNTDRNEPFTVEPGMRIAQLLLVAVPEVDLVEVDELPESERGVRGFGSSRVVWAAGRGAACRPFCAGATVCSSAATRSPARSTGCFRAAASTPASRSPTRSTASSRRRSASTTSCRSRGRWRSSTRSRRPAASRRS